jgi:hypothetical protein
LVRPVGVVLLAPRVDRGLGILDAHKGLMGVQQLQLQGLVQALNLPRSRWRPGLGQPLSDAVLPADPLEQHLRRARLAETPGELLAVVRQHFSGHPVFAHRLHERRAHRPAGGAQDDRGNHAVPGVVIDPGNDLALAAAGQEQAGGHIQLPQLHRRRALPPDVLVAAPAPGTGWIS